MFIIDEKEVFKKLVVLKMRKIESIKDSKSKNEKVSLDEENTCTIELLKSFFGEDVNCGILREIYSEVRKLLFESSSYSIESNSITGGSEYVLRFYGDKISGNLCFSISPTFLADFRFCEIFMTKVVGKSGQRVLDEKFNFTSSDGRLYFSSHYKNSEKIEQKTESLSFDEDGIEMLRTITVDTLGIGTEREIKTTRMERDSSDLTLVRVWNSEMESKDAQSGKITSKPYSLDSAVTGRLATSDSDTLDILLAEEEFESHVYSLFPDLREVVIKRLSGSKKVK